MDQQVVMSRSVRNQRAQLQRACHLQALVCALSVSVPKFGNRSSSAVAATLMPVTARADLPLTQRQAVEAPLSAAQLCHRQRRDSAWRWRSSAAWAMRQVKSDQRVNLLVGEAAIRHMPRHILTRQASSPR
jgi:hypothetical protein